ncbi:MAG: hypothetical protein H0T92_02415, partial [Pyrinomonadaceae bacterium]|nr:hypothetical protein [Pyrinomonadaceae bacterium]
MGLTAYAQQPSRSLSDNIAALSVRASQLLPLLQYEVIARLLIYINLICVSMAVVVALYSFVRQWRESGGGGIDTIYWFIRLAICLFLVGSGPFLVGKLVEVGKWVAEGNEMAGSSGRSVVFGFYKDNEVSFNESYQKFAEGHFTVNVNGETLEIDGAPANSSTGGILGVVYDVESNVKNIDRKLDLTSYELPQLFAIFNALRTFLDGGDLWQIVLAAILTLIAKLLSPFAVVMAIDKSMAHRFTWPYVYGVIVLTVFWPSVSYVIRGVAYMCGNIAMAVGDTTPLYVWDFATMNAIKSPLQQPAYTIGIACFVMFLCSVGVWLSPFVTGWLVAGKFYEGVSTMASGVTGELMSTGVETYTQTRAEGMRRYATEVQAEAGYRADVTRATGEYTAGNLGARARQTMATAGVQGNKIAQIGQIYAARTNQVAMAQAGMQFGVSSAQAAAALNKGETYVRTKQGIGDAYAEQAKATGNIETNKQADTQRWFGDKTISTGAYVGSGIRGIGKDGNGQTAGLARGAAIAVEVGTGAVGLHQQYQSIQRRAEGQQVAQDAATDKLISNKQEAASGHYNNQETFVQSMTVNQEKYAAGQTAAANASAAQAAGGVERGSAVQIGGINRGTAMELQGNQVRMDAQVQAADINRTAAVQAARINFAANVMSNVGRSIAR